MASKALTFKLFGHDVSAGKTFKKVGKDAAGVATGIGAAWGAAKIADFAKQSMDAFANLGGETLKLQRYMGGSAEDASRLAHAFTMTGVDSSAAATSLGVLSKHLAANDKAAQSMGVAFKDQAGNLKPLQEVLPGLADRFAKMPAGAGRTALALKLFGKQGMALLPFLSKGAAGVKELMAESDALGTTLSGKDLDAVKKNTAAKRKFGEAVKGLQLAFGKELYPMLSKVATFLTEKVVPIVRQVVEWLQRNKDTVSIVATVIGVLVAGIKIWTIAQAALNVVLALNPIGLVVIAIAALVAGFILMYKKVGWFRRFVDAVFGGIKTVIGKVVEWFKAYVWPVLKRIIGFIVEYYKMLWRVVSWVFRQVWTVVSGYIRFFRERVWPVIRAVVGAMVESYKRLWNTVRDVWGAIWEKVKWARDKLWGAAMAIKGFFVGIWDGIKDAAQTAFEWVRKIWNSTLGGKGFHIPGTSVDFRIPMLADGGIVTRPTLAMIGEAGPEAVVPLGRGGFGGGVHIHLSGSYAGSKEQLARTVVGALQDAQNRGLKLGI